ncbi:unannotated protein [freshwater metagenome]|uniref:Unannotated protein n=1 Tax=freshwater metagenome TaxID=449393 RepID=A0A6J7S1J2_9ZZZZ
MDVATDAVAFAAHDQHALGVDLDPRHAVDDVNASSLELARPGDVGALIETRFQLHKADGLLAHLGRADQ